jgi:hypothetical protein
MTATGSGLRCQGSPGSGGLKPLHVQPGLQAEESTLSFFSGGWGHVGNYGLGIELADMRRTWPAISCAF